MKYRREIDGLRAIAVLPVILYHAGLGWFSGGFVGVDVFFVISGYLITTIILDEKARDAFSLIGFYERRARRIFPALIFVLVACLPFAWLWMLPNDLKEFSQSIVAVSAFASNVFFWLKSGYFETAADLKPLLHTWSLAVEEQYYVLFPLFLMLFWFLGRRRLMGLLIVAAVVSLGAAQWGSMAKQTGTFYLLPTRAWELLIGAAISFLHFDRKVGVDPPAVRQAGSLMGLLLIGTAVFAFDQNTPFPSLYTLLPTAGAALIIMFATPETIAGRVLGNKILVGVGLISYSAYLWHQPLFAFARLRTFDEPSDLLLLTLGASALVLAYFSWKYVEQPFRNKQRVGRRMIFIQAAAMSFVMVAIGGVGHLTAGFEDRFKRNNDAVMIARLDELKADRQLLIRAGECYFNKRGKHVDIESFLENWDCTSDAEFPAAKPISVIVVGDSHSGDIVAALKLNGLLALQMGGADCALAPDFMTRECRAQFEHLRTAVSGSADYQYIALVARLERGEIAINALKETIDYWQQFGKELVFFTGMPDFSGYEYKLAKGIAPKPTFDMANLSEASDVLDFLRSRAVKIVNTREIFCSLAPDCGYLDGAGDLLLVDQEHLSRTGAAEFGKRLLQQDSLFAAFRPEPPPSKSANAGSSAAAIDAAHLIDLGDAPIDRTN